MNENDCIVCGKELRDLPAIEPGKAALRPRVHQGCAHRTPGVLAIGYVAHDVRSLAPWPVRLWRLLANPFLYLFTGHVRW